jgi:hypothetical protein
MKNIDLFYLTYIRRNKINFITPLISFLLYNVVIYLNNWLIGCLNVFVP